MQSIQRNAEDYEEEVSNIFINNEVKSIFIKALEESFLNEEETKSFIDVHDALEKEKEKKIEKKENSILKSYKDYLWN